jgi:hypothetical protein
MLEAVGFLASMETFAARIPLLLDPQSCLLLLVEQHISLRCLITSAPSLACRWLITASFPAHRCRLAALAIFVDNDLLSWP